MQGFWAMGGFLKNKAGCPAEQAGRMLGGQRRRGAGLLAATMMVALSAAAPVLAEERVAQAAPGAEQRAFNIPAQQLASALNAFGRQGGIQVTVDSATITGVQGQAVAGRFTVDEALRRLLAGTGVTGRFIDDRTVLLTKTAPQDGAVLLDPVMVEAAARAPRTSVIGGLPPDYAGGQVARGTQVGLLGNRDVMDTPFATSSYTARTIESQQAKSLADVLANEPSIRSDWSSRGGYSDSFSLRGLAVGAGDVAFGGLFGVAPRTFTSLEGIERVEVLRGLSALVSGVPPGGSLGGVINLVPKRAGNEPLTRFTTSYESDGYLAGHADIGRRFGPDNAFGVRVNAVYGKGDTAIDNQSAEIKHATAGVDYRGDAVRLSGDLGYLERRTDAPMRAASVSPTLTDVPGAPKAGTNFAQPWGFVELKSLHGALKGEVDLGSSVTAYASAGFRQNPTDLLVSVPTITALNGNFTERNLYFFDDVNSQTAETGLRTDFDTGPVNHRVNLSASAVWQTRYNVTYTLNTVASNLYNPVVVPKPNLSGYDTHPRLLSRQRLAGLAIADTLSVLDERVQLTLGLRRQQVTTDSYNGAVPSRQTSRYSESATTPAVALVVKPDPRLSLYANYIEGLSQGPVAPSGTANAGQVFAPFVSKQLEAGVKLDLGRLGATLSAFQITQPSGLATASRTGGLPVFGVDGEQRNRGIELYGYGELTEGLRLLGGVMVLDAVQTKTAGGVNNGKDAVASPDVQLNLGLEWDTPFLDGLTLSGGAVYTSGQYVNAANTQRIPSWTRFDVGASYLVEAKDTPIELRARVTNLFDKSYWASASPQLGALSTGAPRTFALSASVGF